MYLLINLRKVSFLLIAITIVAISMSQSFFVAKADGRWQSIGPTGGFVWDLKISPGYLIDQTVFAGTDGGGIYKTTDGGETWRTVNRGLSTKAIPAMSISPNYPQDSTIFAAGPDGVYRSTDQGTIWNLINNGMDKRCFKI